MHDIPNAGVLKIQLQQEKLKEMVLDLEKEKWITKDNLKKLIYQINLVSAKNVEIVEIEIDSIKAKKLADTLNKRLKQKINGKIRYICFGHLYETEALEIW